jgi:large subunit ribosomal protein L21
MANMHAIIRSGGKQYRVAAQDVIQIETLAGTSAGDEVVFDQVLAISGPEIAKVGAPLVTGATVTGKVIAHDHAEKVIIFKKKRRHNYRRKNGHRQPITVVRIEAIQPG